MELLEFLTKIVVTYSRSLHTTVSSFSVALSFSYWTYGCHWEHLLLWTLWTPHHSGLQAHQWCWDIRDHAYLRPEIFIYVKRTLLLNEHTVCALDCYVAPYQSSSVQLRTLFSCSLDWKILKLFFLSWNVIWGAWFTEGNRNSKDWSWEVLGCGCLGLFL